MLFNNKLLEKVQMFYSDEWLGADGTGAPYDKIVVTFEGEKSFLVLNILVLGQNPMSFLTNLQGQKAVKDCLTQPRF